MDDNAEDNAEDNYARICIIGSGFGGLGMAMQLKKHGIDDFVILERAGEVGGTWQANTYPGAQCDIPSLLYSFSFAPNPNWTRLYPLQPEIKAYLTKCAQDYDLVRHIRFDTDVQDSVWDEEHQLWRMYTCAGEFSAQILVGALGPFSEPAIPDLPGLASFGGTVFHSTTWEHDHDLTGARVGVIGTGASAVQFIPEVQPIAAELTVFQRTPTWILPHPDRPLGVVPKQVFRRAPLVQQLLRRALNTMQEALVPGFVYEPRLLKSLALLGRAHLRRQVRDPELRAKLTPTFAFGCKRPTFSNRYYPALAAANTTVVTDGIREVTPRGIVTADGTEHELDTIIFGTGFRMADNPAFEKVHGVDGRSLAEVWAGGNTAAYLGTTIAGFPNFFMLLGPNSVVYTSQVVTIEAQVRYVLDALQAMERDGLASIDVRADVQQEFVAQMDARLAGSVWNAGGCSSYYLSESGRNFTFWPGFVFTFLRRTQRIDLGDYVTRKAAAPIPARTKVRSA